MKSLLAFVFIAVAIVSVNADQSVKGYTRKDGTYVQPYHRSDSNGTKSDNYSTQGNTNPYTGQPGTKKP